MSYILAARSTSWDARHHHEYYCYRVENEREGKKEKIAELSSNEGIMMCRTHRWTVRVWREKNTTKECGRIVYVIQKGN